jgi:hypothetical protein
VLPLPGSASGTSNSRIAVATGIPRAWWLQGSSLGPSTTSSLVTATFGSSTTTVVPVTLDDGRASLPNQPWATPDGTILLISTTYAPPSKDTTEHLFYARLDAGTGLTLADAQRIYPVDAADADGDPSLTGDACALLFTRNGALYGALRD